MDVRFAPGSAMAADPALAMALQPELQPKERVRWAQRPVAGRYALSKSFAAVAMGIFFVVFSNFWMSVAGAVGIGFGYGFFWMLGLPFMAIGLCLVLSPVYRFLKARRMIYAVTDQRVIVLSQFLSRRVLSVDHARLGRIDKKVDRGGVGDLVFLIESGGRVNRSESLRHGFFATPDVDGAEQQIRRMTSDGR